MRIVCNGNPALRKVSPKVEEMTPAMEKLAERLVDSLENSKVPGIGLAAPQIGINQRMIVIDTAADEEDEPREGILSPGEALLEPMMPVVLVNPEIVESSKECSVMCEGCLSLPGVKGEVTRPVSVVLRAQLMNGENIQVECGNLLARCLQHEIDHLDGILFIDRCSEAEKDEASAQMHKLEKEELRKLSRKG